MPTLLMRLRAPMMSWGDHSRFTIRDTRREPTKSAVIGLLCAALGRSRSESVADLAALTMGVRVNKEGIVQCDYHTVLDAIRSSGKDGDTVVSHRYYIADADYLVGLEGSDRPLLETLDRALQNPVWQVYFGRKSFLPSAPIRVGIDDRPLGEALRDCERYPLKPTKKAPQQLRLAIEVPDSNDVRRDVPLNWERRHFGSRCVATEFFSIV
ncbi:MAG: type I-E CRISPR-associated protein Cas5/CasD [Oscillatoriales cyanobacterium SM2_1_8]|nr:type I-E CRISPR-associated protein Cas5/CasD [Oscillatoriales cyanobacterium SM2_1_8]